MNKIMTESQEILDLKKIIKGLEYIIEIQKEHIEDLKFIIKHYKDMEHKEGDS